MAISYDQMIRRLREAGYSFKRHGRRAEIWKQGGSVRRVNLPLLSYFNEEYARLILSQAGLTSAEIDDFIE